MAKKRNIVTVALTDEMADLLELDKVRKDRYGNTIAKADLFRNALFNEWLPKQLGIGKPAPMPAPQSYREAKRPDHAARMARYRARKKQEKENEARRMKEMEAAARTRMMADSESSAPVVSHRRIQPQAPEPVMDESYYTMETSPRGLR